MEPKFRQSERQRLFRAYPGTGWPRVVAIQAHEDMAVRRTRIAGHCHAARLWLIPRTL